MPIYRRGFDFEDRICTQLERSGFTVKRDPVLDHKHKLDFIILSFPENLSYFALGVQVTNRLDDADKQEEFYKANRRNTTIQKSLYLEVGDKLDLEAGGSALVIAVAMNCQFNRAYTKAHTVGATIYEDLTYQFFDIPERIQEIRARLQQEAAQAAPIALSGAGGAAPARAVRPLAPIPISSPGLSLGIAGMLESYKRVAGYGYIVADDGEKYFCHVNKVSDDVLRERLNALPNSAEYAAVNMRVTFESAGRTRPAALYPEARNVRLED